MGVDARVSSPDTLSVPGVSHKSPAIPPTYMSSSSQIVVVFAPCRPNRHSKMTNKTRASPSPWKKSHQRGRTPACQRTRRSTCPCHRSVLDAMVDIDIDIDIWPRIAHKDAPRDDIGPEVVGGIYSGGGSRGLDSGSDALRERASDCAVGPARSVNRGVGLVCGGYAICGPPYHERFGIGFC